MASKSGPFLAEYSTSLSIRLWSSGSDGGPAAGGASNGGAAWKGEGTRGGKWGGNAGGGGRW